MAQSKEERRDSAKRKRLWVLYRITPEEEAAVEQFQREAFADYSVLLTKGNPNKKALLFNDHDHTTGRYRGRLSYLINKALGVLEGAYKERTPRILRALAYYLDFPPSSITLGGDRYGLLGRAKVKKKMVYGPPKEGVKNGK